MEFSEKITERITECIMISLLIMFVAVGSHYMVIIDHKNEASNNLDLITNTPIYFTTTTNVFLATTTKTLISTPSPSEPIFITTPTDTPFPSTNGLIIVKFLKSEPILVITNCPVVYFGDTFIPKIKDEHWNIITQFFSQTNITISFRSNRYE